MKQLFKVSIPALMLFLIHAPVQADEQQIRKVLAESLPNLKPDLIRPSEMKGLYEVLVGSNVFYISEDGKYILEGKLIDVAARKDLTDERLAGVRVKALEKVGRDQMIVFEPKESKYKVSVFTDIDCGYCRKLHSEIDQFMKEGITIQYLFFPRAGIGSKSYQKAVSVWCAKDRQKALTEAKKGNDPESKTCDNPVKDHMRLGQEFGMTGTPMLVTEKGAIFPGYMPANQLAKALAMEKNEQPKQ